MAKPDDVPQEIWTMALEFQSHMSGYEPEVKNTAYAIMAGMVSAYEECADIASINVTAERAIEQMHRRSDKLEPRSRRPSRDLPE